MAKQSRQKVVTHQSLDPIDQNIAAISAAAFRDAFRNALAVQGRALVVEDGWLVERFASGEVTRIREVPPRVAIASTSLTLTWDAV